MPTDLPKSDLLQDTGREARLYTLTKLGRRQLEEQRASWNRLSTAISIILSTAE